MGQEVQGIVKMKCEKNEGRENRKKRLMVISVTRSLHKYKISFYISHDLRYIASAT